MDQQYNIANLIMDLDESIEDRISIRTPEDSLTYGQLRHLTTCFALHLRERGVGRSSCVAISTTDVRVAIASILAIALLGGSWVQANRWSLANEALGITHLLHGGDEDLPTVLNAIEIDQSWTQYPDGIDPSQPIEFEGYASPDDTWLIANSSGSTGHVKHFSISYRSAYLRIKVRIDNSNLFFAMIPPVFASTLHPLAIVVVQNFFAVFSLNGTVCGNIGKRSFLYTELNTIQSTPNVTKHIIGEIDCDSNFKVKMFSSEGAAISDELMKKLHVHFEHVGVHYGTTETGVIFRRVFSPGDPPTSGIGGFLEGVRIEFTDDAGQAVEPGETGIIRLRSEVMVSEYIGDPETTAAAFRDGWFYPGDIGYLTTDGQLVITGRLTDILNLGGVKVNAVSIDEVIQAQDDILDGICFAKPDDLGVDELAAIVTLSDVADPDAVSESVSAACRKELGASYVPKYIYVSDRVPRNERGKATRHLAVEAVKGMEPAWVLPSPNS